MTRRVFFELVRAGHHDVFIDNVKVGELLNEYEPALASPGDVGHRPGYQEWRFYADAGVRNWEIADWINSDSRDNHFLKDAKQHVREGFNREYV